MRAFVRTLGAWLALFACVLGSTAFAQTSDKPLEINIPAGSLAEALERLGDQSGLQIMYEPAVAKGIRVAAVSGTLTASDALGRLIAHTGLKADRVNEKTVVLKVAAQEAEPVKNPEEPTAGKQPTQEPVEELSEIVVTAQKRVERLQDVPVPVATLSADSLVNNGLLRLQDYYSSVPGLNVTPYAQSQQIVTIRGITTGGFTNPTVGITVDDVPYGASTALGGGLIVPDIDPNDLSRVEVLRGPQGTLYGASSMGGLLKFVTVDPSTAGVGGRIQLGTSSIRNGDDLGYNARGSLNFPLSDTFAIRASGFTRVDPGYIDVPAFFLDPDHSKKGINRAEANGGRLSALWRPSDAWSLKLSALYQDIEGDGASDAAVPTAGFPQTIGLGDLEQSNLRGTGWYERKAQVYSVTLAAKLGSAELTAVSGYNINSFKDSTDASYLLGFFSQTFFGVAGGPILSDNKAEKFTQEIRLSVPIGERLEWLIGAFYADEDARFQQQYAAVDPVTAQVAGVGYTSDFPTTNKEYAGFTDLTFHFTERFDVQVGARESHLEQTYGQANTGVYVPFLNNGASSPFVAPERSSSANAFTYLVTPRWRLSPDLMVYARFASGYRPGGPNISPGGSVPSEYEPDKTQNYELGMKGSFLDHKLLLDASLYYIDWKDIQVTLLNFNTFQNYNINGSAAKSQGVELSVDARPTKGLTVSAWAVWSDAKLKEDFPGFGAVGASGDRLPNSSRFSGSVSLQQDFPISSLGTGFVGASLTYVGDRMGVFTGSPARQELPAYARTDLRAGLTRDPWTTNLFVTNVTDRRGILYGGIGAYPPFGFTYIQPRTFGLNVSRSF